jgi:multidrug efflux pump subunit AcrA (membrane-fusion protein)
MKSAGNSGFTGHDALRRRLSRPLFALARIPHWMVGRIGGKRLGIVGMGPSRGKLIAFAIVISAGVLALYTSHESVIRPSSSDASIDADVVHVASLVGGRVIEITVAENTRIAKDDLLFQIDPVPYRLAVTQT